MKSIIAILIATLLTFKAFAAAPPVEEGKAIFSNRCAACHNVNRVITGPALAGVDQRHSMDWIVRFVNSSQTLIAQGDKDAVTLFEKFNRITMPDHSDLTADNIKSIVEYIKTEAKTATDKPPFRRPAEPRPAYNPLGVSDIAFFISFLCVVVLLIAGLLFAVHVKAIERSMRGSA